MDRLKKLFKDIYLKELFIFHVFFLFFKLYFFKNVYIYLNI